MPIAIPQGVEVKIGENNVVTVKGGTWHSIIGGNIKAKHTGNINTNCSNKNFVFSSNFPLKK